MKRVITVLLIALYSLAAKSQENTLESFFIKTNKFLSENIQDGRVGYATLKSNPSKLKELIDLVAQTSLTEKSKQEQDAFYINAYNLIVIDAILKEYPVNSPKSISGFFESNKHLVAGEKMTVNQIEKDKLDPGSDPRFHFVLVCGALSCPIIEPFAYLPSTLEKQLDEQTRKAINDNNFLRVNVSEQKVGMSKIFSWYRADFISKSSSLKSFINEYRINKIPNSYKTSFYDYDWTLNDKVVENPLDDRAEVEKSNLQTFTPSALFKKGQYEVNVFNSIYTQQEIRDKNGDDVKLGGQTQSFFNSLIQVTAGVTKTARFNVGLDLGIVKAKYSSIEEGALQVFSNNSAVFQKTVLSSIAPRIKFKPIRSIPRLSVQSSFIIPIAQDQQSPNFIAHDRYTWFTQFFYDKSFGEKFQLFLETDFLYRIKRNSVNDKNFFRVPLSGFLSYFPSSKSTVYVFSQYSPRFETVSNSVDSQFGLSQWFTQIGIGTKYQLTNRIGLELSYADFSFSRNDGAGYNLNFGIKYIHR